MFDLNATIRADAAARLRLPPGVHPAREKAIYQRFLRFETHRLKLHHRKGAGGLVVCRARAEVLDALLQSLFLALQQATPAARLAEAPPHAVVAIGGYGRGELNPCSDLDIMFLYEGDSISDKRPPWFVEPLTEGLIFDIGLKVGHSTRTIAECVKVANEDMRTKTSLIEARLVCGDKALFDEMQQTIMANCVEGHEDEYIQARLRDQAERRAKYRNTVCLQEPNTKNGCGGLRDYQNLLWMAFFKDRSRSLDDLAQRGLIVEEEQRKLANAYDYILRVRNELHYHTGRPADQLQRSIQPAVARNLGYTDRSPSRRIEKFMQDYYLHARTIYLLTRTLEQRLALKTQAGTSHRQSHRLCPPFNTGTSHSDGFTFSNGHIQAESATVFRDNPILLMRVFRHAQQRRLTLHPDLAHLVRQNLKLVDRKFRADPRVHKTFVEILNQRGNVARVIRAMHETGLLGAYLPAFGRLTCLVQHEFFHQYTTDEHTLVCLDKLDVIGTGTGPPHTAIYTDMFRKEIQRPFILYLALLLHDAGKATHKPNHAFHSSRISLTVARRLGLDKSATTTLVRLIRLHLAMVQVSQRRDLDDLNEIRRFAAQVETGETLSLLTLLTVADALGTSDDLWNGFKDSLLLTLYHRTREMLAGADEFAAAEERRRSRLTRAVRAMLPQAIAEDELTAHFESMPPRYFLLCSPDEIVADIELVHQFLERLYTGDGDPLEPVVAWHDEPHRGFSVVRLATWDRSGLFNKMAGALTAAGLNILSAEIFTRTDDIVLDTFYVTDALTGQLATRDAHNEFESVLRAALAGDIDLANCIRQRMARWPAYRPNEGERIPTAIRFDNSASDSRTVLDVEAEDCVGLLHAISKVLSDLGFNISLARICSGKGAVSDTFYLTDRAGGKILDPQRQVLIESRIREAVARLM